MKKLLSIALAVALMLSLTACWGSGGDSGGGAGGGEAAQFTAAMRELQDAGATLKNEGLALQSESCYAFAGASLSSLRYAVEVILYLKGEGSSIEDIAQGSRYIGWDEIAAVCYASPYPYYFEGLLWQIQGENDKAKEAYTNTLLNPAYPDEGVDFSYLRDMDNTELYKLRDELRAMEDEIYGLFSARPIRLARDGSCFYPEYLRAKAGEALEAGDSAGAAAYAKAAALCDSFDPLNFRSAVVCCLAAGDAASAALYLDAGLLIAPDDEGLNMLYASFESLAGGEG